MNKRMLSLDLLRLVAVVLVLVSHLKMIEGMPYWLTPFTRFGSLGVNLFFVLSGFLVSGLIFAEYRHRGSFSVTRFYTRRAWKIYPPLYLMLGFTYFYSRYGLGWKIPDRKIFAEVFFLQNYFVGHWNHTWSLAVEEHFYIALPLILLALAKTHRMVVNPFRIVPALVGAVMFVALAARLVNFGLHSTFTLHTHGFPTHLRVDSLFLGVLLAYVYHFHSFEALQRWRHALIAAGLALVIPLGLYGQFQDFYRCTIGLTQESVGCASLLVGAVLCKVPTVNFVLWLARLGSYSYSIYLWHMATIYWVLPHVTAPWGVKAALYLSAAFAIGVVLALLWEVPTLDLRDRLFPSNLTEARKAA